MATPNVLENLEPLIDTKCQNRMSFLRPCLTYKRSPIFVVLVLAGLLSLSLFAVRYMEIVIHRETVIMPTLGEETLAHGLQADDQLKIVPGSYVQDTLAFSWYVGSCFGGRQPRSIEDLPSTVKLLKSSPIEKCRTSIDSFSEIYRIRRRFGTIAISESFMEKVRRWLSNNETLISATREQVLIFVDNLYTKESVVFNPVRANRPGSGGGDLTLKHIAALVNESAKDCDFCQYDKYTAADSFGYMTSDHNVIVSNTFKIETYHGMLLFGSHNPLQVSQLQFLDGMLLAMRWFQRVRQLVPDHLYRIMYWDILPKASASQIHPHVHLTVGDSSYYSKWNQLHSSALAYSKSNGGKNYWTELMRIHNSLGLAFSFGDASALAYLTPQKEYETVVMARRPCLDFFRLTYFVIQSLQMDMEQYAVSLGYVFPRVGANPDANGQELPMLFRVVSRGPADNPRSDISSFDLFGTPNVNKDPYQVIWALRKSVAFRSKESIDLRFWSQPTDR